jgi:acetyltransferase-like isoleucine patch superfamily enzyme
MNSFYSIQELNNLGFKSHGESVFISRKASFYDIENMIIGNHVRIDDFCILSGKITLGSHVHISAYCALYGSHGIRMEDYTGLSPRCSVFSASDDFSGDFLISPMVKTEYTNVTGGLVLIKKYSQVGAGCVILPNLIIEEGVAVGAMSLINKTLSEWGVYIGIPAKRIHDRKRGLLDKMKE